MKKLLLVGIIMYILTGLNAQSSIKGIATDSKTQSPVAFANIYLSSVLDSTIVSGTMTEEEGFFSLEIQEGTYQLVAQMIGYETFIINAFSVANDTLIDIGTIEMIPTALNLEEVIVRGERSHIKTEFGKKILYVGQDIANGGNSALDALENLPSVEVDLRGTIQVRGDHNVLIYINGKPSRKDGIALSHFPAQLIDRIELITNPSAAYSAEGVAGIINIILKKQKQKGLKVDLSGGVDAPIHFEGINYKGSLSMNYKVGALNYYANLGGQYEDYQKQSRSYLNCRNDDCFLINYNRLNDKHGLWQDYDANVGIQWDIDTTSTLEWDVVYQRWDTQENTFEDVEYKYAEEEETSLYVVSSSKALKNEYETSLSYQKKIKKNTILNAIISFGEEIEIGDGGFNNQNIDISNSPFFSSIKFEDYDEREQYFAGKIDFKQPLFSGTLKGGLQSDFAKYQSLQNIAFNDTSTSDVENNFTSEEWLHGIYILHQKKSGKFKWEIGTRLEHFTRESYRIRMAETFNKKFTNVFPSLNLDYTIRENQTLSFSYTRRTKRPKFYQVNPYISYSDPLNIRIGNPDLSPSFANAFELGYMIKGAKVQCLTSIFNKTTNDVIRSQITAEEGRTIRTYENFGKEINLGAEMSLLILPFKWLKLDQQFTFYRRSYSGISNENIVFENDFSTWYIRFIQQLKFDKGWKIQFRQFYRSPYITPQIKHARNIKTSIGIRKSFQENKLTFNLVFSDLFNTNIIQEDITTETYFSGRELRFPTQKISFSVNYKMQKTY